MSRLKPPGGHGREDTLRRREWLARLAGFPLDDPEPVGPEALKGVIENHVGWMQLPLAVAGPFRLHGTYAEGEFYVPLCTLEGALVLSMTRGALLTSLSGGVKTLHVKQEMSRSPIFVVDDIHDAPDFCRWIDVHYDRIKEVAESTTRHGELLRIDKYEIQNSVILDFVYDTKEASGQNMVSLATLEACQFIRAQFRPGKPLRYYIESNFNCDKNPAAKTLLCGKGHKVIASALIAKRHLHRVVRATAKEYVDVWNLTERGALMAGVVSRNKHVANALTAIYLATGQDVASVAENAIGVSSYEVRNGDDLYATLTMPSISVGTVAAGMRLPTQRRSLELLGCTGENSSKKLAEIVCAAALALEISLGGAIVAEEFVQAHMKYGR